MPVTKQSPTGDEQVRVVVWTPITIVESLRAVARAHDRSLSAEVRIACREHVARASEEARNR